MQITEEVKNQICRHALDEYPDECCGIITGHEQGQAVHKCENIQNRLHAEDPAAHPRDARTAYAIERKEFDRIVLSAKQRGEGIIAFYHSHIDHDAYFSVTDVEAQTVFGEPEFPDALHIVISVRDRKLYDIKYFKWDGDKKDFPGFSAPWLKLPEES